MKYIKEHRNQMEWILSQKRRKYLWLWAMSDYGKNNNNNDFNKGIFFSLFYHIGFG